jgi:hypothetical protein
MFRIEDYVRPYSDKVAILRFQLLEPDMGITPPCTICSIEICEFAYPRSWDIIDARAESIVSEPEYGREENHRKYDILQHIALIVKDEKEYSNIKGK